MQTGLGTLTVWPVGRSAPFCGSMWKTTIVPEFHVLGQQISPGGIDGEIARILALRRLDGHARSSLPVSGSMAKIAMLSCPRFDP